MTFTGCEVCPEHRKTCWANPCPTGYSCVKVRDSCEVGCHIFQCGKLENDGNIHNSKDKPEPSFLDKNKYIIVGSVCGLILVFIIGGLIYAYTRYKKKAESRFNVSMVSNNNESSLSNMSQLSPYQSFKSKSSSAGKLKLVHSNFIDPEFCHKPNKMSVIAEK